MKPQRAIGNQSTQRLLRARLEGSPSVPPIVPEALQSPGEPLDSNTRAFMERRLGHNFAEVRVHTDARAADSAQEVDALAYTVGSHVVFEAGQYAPTTNKGQALLAHELAHVVQQRARATISGTPLLDEHEGVNEHVANASAGAVVSGKEVGTIPPLSGTHTVLQRQRAGSPQASSRRERRRATVAGVEEERAVDEAVDKDYTDARMYVIRFYSTYARIQDDLAEAAHRAIGRFTAVSDVPENPLGANITYQLIRIALGVAPGAESVIKLFDALSKGLRLSMKTGRLATIAFTAAQRTAAGIYGAFMAPSGIVGFATATALDDLSKFDTEGAERIEREQAEEHTNVERLGADPQYRGIVYSTISAHLGPLPTYDANSIRQFEREYELRLYKEFYSPRAYIQENPPYAMGTPYPEEMELPDIWKEVKGIPEPVLLQLMKLTGTQTPLEAVRNWGLKRKRKGTQANGTIRSSSYPAWGT